MLIVSVLLLTACAKNIPVQNESQAIEIAAEFLKIPDKSIDDDTGFPLSYLAEKIEEKSLYIVTLKWRVDDYMWSTIDEVIVYEKTGKCEYINDKNNPRQN